MAEPAGTTSAGIVAVSIALLGPAAGEYAVIVLSALAGSLWALSRSGSAARIDGAVMVLRLVLTAVVLTGGAAYWINSMHEVPMHQLLAPVAFFIGAFGDRWPAALDALWRRLIGRINGTKP